MSLLAANKGHTDKAAAARGGESVIPSHAKSSSAANKNPEMEIDDKELSEDLDEVTMIAEPEDEVHYESG